MSVPSLASPCTGICKYDDATGWCLGCARTKDEIAEWGMGAVPWRNGIWSQIPERLAQLGVAYRRLPWTTDEIRDFVANSFHTGAWSIGVVGAQADFAPGAGQHIKVITNGSTITAHTHGGSIQMRVDDSVRALTFDPASTPLEQARIALVVKRERGRLPMADRVRALGPDPKALTRDPDGHLFDLGLGRKEARFCIRTSSNVLGPALGLPFHDALPKVGHPLLIESPVRVVESALGRVEIDGPIPRPDAPTPDGPHTHLLPDHLATGRSMPVGMGLPRAYLPGAIFYPNT